MQYMYRWSLHFFVIAGLIGCIHPFNNASNEAAHASEQEDADVAELMDALDPTTDCGTLLKEIQAHPKLLTARAREGGWIWELRYRPALCRACMERMDMRLGDEALQSRRADLAGTDLYVLHLQADKPDVKPPMEQQLMAGLIQVVDADTFSAAFLHKEATSSSAPYASYLIGFDTPENGRARTIMIRGIGGRSVRLELSSERLNEFIHLGKEQV
ncbi:MAG: hypothetical protein QM724_13405 [Flavobacteriales bacterium]